VIDNYRNAVMCGQNPNASCSSRSQTPRIEILVPMKKSRWAEIYRQRISSSTVKVDQRPPSSCLMGCHQGLEGGVSHRQNGS
jgi:hypothetical protein